jgi:hypothetical protein
LRGEKEDETKPFSMYKKYSIQNGNEHEHCDVEIDDRHLKLTCCIANKIGDCNKIADEMNLSADTVRSLIRDFKSLLGLTYPERKDTCDQRELVLWALKYKLIALRNGIYVSIIQEYLADKLQLKLEFEWD